MSENTHPLGVFAPVASPGAEPPVTPALSAQNPENPAPVLSAQNPENPAPALSAQNPENPAPALSAQNLENPAPALSAQNPVAIAAVVAPDDYLRGGWHRAEESPSVYRAFVQTLVRERLC